MIHRNCANRKRRFSWLSDGVLVVLISLLAPIPVSAAAAVEAVEAETQASEEDPEEGYITLDEVIVYGNDGELVQGLHAEAELDEQGVAAYGADTVGDLLTQVAPDVDNSAQGPVILINGKPANGIRSVNDLPSESVQSIQVLPAQAAAALGYEPTRRVINVVLKQTFRQGQGTATVRGATAGRGRSGQLQGGIIKLEGNSIHQFSLRASKTEPLLEAHRDIQSQLAGIPYDFVGNVVAWPASGNDIDPQLSALKGYPVTVLGVPAGMASPTLDEFADLANISNVSDLGRYRTLISDGYQFGFNGNWGMPLPRNSALQMNFYGDRNESAGMTGAATALLHVPAGSPFSPFSQDVGVARYLGGPLGQDSEFTNANVSASLSTQMGKWRGSLDTSIGWRSSTTDNDRRIDTAMLQAAIDAGVVNPFESPPEEYLGEVLADHAKSRQMNGSMMLQASGNVYKLPAGNATLSLRGQLSHNQQRSRTWGTNNVSSRRTRQDKVAFAGLQLPLIGRPTTPQGFAMGAEVNGTARDVTGSGTLFDNGFGINGRMGNRFNMRVGVYYEKVAPQPDVLNNPIVTIDDYRAYDFIRQETVLVRYITGGNPDLGVENRRRTSFSGQVRPLTKLDLTFNAEYTRTVGRDAVSQLPAVSEDVQAAFPDRYRRDASGRLVEIDGRLVSYARSETEQLRWGGNFRRTFGVPQTPAGMNSGQMIIIMSDGSGSEDLSGAGWRLSANFTHTWQLTNTRLAREGLPEQDLLSGGTGTGMGQSRHNVQGRVGLAFNGTGLQLNANWKSGTHIIAGTTGDPNDITFDPLMRLDLSAFANLGTVFPASTLMKGTRLTFAVENVLDDKQRVTDETGATPLRFQPDLSTPLGRVVSLSLRKSL